MNASKPILIAYDGSEGARAAIVDAADREDARAIVVGSRGLSGVKSALLGSVANGVVHHSTRPVVVIPSSV